MEKDVDKYAKIIWDYMQINHKLEKVDVIFVFGSHDISVAERAADLYLQGYAPYIVCSGKSGKNTDGIFSETEAKIFSDIILSRGIPRDRIFLEERATNTGENIIFTQELLFKNKIKADSFILVGKPYMERRTYAAFAKQWVGKNFIVTSPQKTFKEYTSKSDDFKKQAISVMVGDLQRIREYPRLGFQIEQDIPRKVWSAWEKLIDMGYTKFLLN